MSEEKSHIKNRLIIITLILIFSGPMLVSWWLFNYTDVMEKGSRGNHGDLIIPPKPLPNIRLIDPLSEINSGQLHGKWSLFYITGDHCDQICIDLLYRMRQIRLAVGKHYHRVQRVLLMAKESDAGHIQISKEYKGQWLVATDDINLNEFLGNFHLVDIESSKRKDRLYLIDPLGNLMMSYSVDADPIGIIKDLKRLLKASRIG